MAKLVSTAEIRKASGSGQKSLYLDSGTIVTPAARDLAAELGIDLKQGPAPQQEAQNAAQTVAQNAAKAPEQPAGPAGTGSLAPLSAGITPMLISQIVKEVLASMPGLQPAPVMVREEDPGGVRLVRGNTVECEPFNTGNPRDKVGLKEIVNIKESPHMATGFMTIEDSAFSWELTYEEIDYVVEGTLDIIVNGKTYRGYPGDVFYIPRNTKVTFSSPDKARFFFVTYPANWAELSNYEK